HLSSAVLLDFIESVHYDHENAIKAFPLMVIVSLERLNEVIIHSFKIFNNVDSCLTARPCCCYCLPIYIIINIACYKDTFNASLASFIILYVTIVIELNLISKNFCIWFMSYRHKDTIAFYL